MHLKRWITSLLALPFVIWLIMKGGPVFAIFIACISILGLREYFRIIFNTTGQKIFSPVSAPAFVAGPLIIAASYANSFKGIAVICSVDLFIVALLAAIRFRPTDQTLTPDAISKQIQGIIYIPVMLAFIIFIRNSHDGAMWVFLMLLIVFAGDTGAFYVGSYFGKRKLCPFLSPGKTIEGAIGGLVACILSGAGFKFFFFPQLLWTGSLLLFVSVGIAGPTGDIFESMLKRAGKIKDSGKILPGHGGVLDRIDALLFAAPVTYFFKEFILT
jgi:phosphatidate cytidylyltransferase